MVINGNMQKIFKHKLFQDSSVIILISADWIITQALQYTGSAPSGGGGSSGSNPDMPLKLGMWRNW